jgi:ribonucleotide monophosphatase NagD (HAD superfamily)
VLDSGLDAVRGFVSDVDGTLAHRGPDGRARPQPGAVEVLERFRASGRPFVLFTNGSHVRAQTMAQALREDGLPIADDELLTPVKARSPTSAGGAGIGRRCCSARR